MTLNNLQKQLLQDIEKTLRAKVDSLDFGHSQPLKEMIVTHMGWQDDNGSRGKRIRPLLTLLCCGACQAETQSAMPAAAAIEFLHNFTLIHDDIEDQSLIRHGRPTLWKTWGIPQAINAGDALFSIAQITILDLSNTCNMTVALSAALQFNQVCLHLTQGQYLDIAFESAGEVTVENYLEMIKGKTAALIAFSAAMGGMAAGRDKATVESLYEFGESLGLAFQIQDDYLGIWGDPKVTGKSAASDLIARKKSLPVLYGLQNCQEFRALWEGEQISPEQVTHLSSLLESCGAQDFVISQSKNYTEKAFSTLETLFRERNAYSDAIFELCKQLLHRNF